MPKLRGRQNYPLAEMAIGPVRASTFANVEMFTLRINMVGIVAANVAAPLAD
jgi:hypothetical protein